MKQTKDEAEEGMRQKKDEQKTCEIEKGRSKRSKKETDEEVGVEVGR